MANLLYQQIEMLSREKHIETTVVVSAIEDAMVVAARKYYKTEEDLRAKFNPETGQVDVFSVHTVVEEVTESFRRNWHGNYGCQADGRPRANCGANRQASHSAKGARSRARHNF